jgi:hypothetical protein
MPEGLHGIPVQPRLRCRVAGLEDQATAGAQGRSHRPQCRRPVLVGHDLLGDIRRHGRDVGLHRRQIGRETVHPPHPVRAGLGPGDVQRRGRRVDPGHVEATAGEHAGEGPRAAPDVRHTASAELNGHGQVGIQAATILVHRVVQPGQAPLRIG